MAFLQPNFQTLVYFGWCGWLKVTYCIIKKWEKPWNCPAHATCFLLDMMFRKCFHRCQHFFFLIIINPTILILLTLLHHYHHWWGVWGILWSLTSRAGHVTSAVRAWVELVVIHWGFISVQRNWELSGSCSKMCSNSPSFSILHTDVMTYILYSAWPFSWEKKKGKNTKDTKSKHC